MKFYYPKDKNGNPIGFKTPESQVYDSTGKSLTDKLTELDGKIGTTPSTPQDPFTVSNNTLIIPNGKSTYSEGVLTLS